MVDWPAWRAKGEQRQGSHTGRGDGFVSDWMFPCIDPLTGTELTFKLWCETGGAVLVHANGLIRNNLGRLSRRRRNSRRRLALDLVFASFLFRAYVDVHVDQSWANYQVEKGI